MQKTIAQVSLKNTAKSTSPDSKMKPITLHENENLPTREKYINDSDYINALESWCIGLSKWVERLDSDNKNKNKEIKYLQKELKYDKSNRPL